jgi:3-hydroxyisobutyrate dehydrogenase-like beta-hydroxyacid dehydrogenase
MSKNITVFGTGLMGSAFARALLSAGFDVTVWNRTPERCAPLVSEGAKLAHSPAEGAAASDILLFLVLDQDAVEHILESVDIAGRTVLNYVTGTPDDGTRVAELVTRLGGSYVDAAIEAYPHQIGSRDALINYSGDKQVWQTVSDVRDALSGMSPFVSDNPGGANVLDGAWVATFHCVALGGFHEAVSFAQTHGVSIETMEESLDYFLGLLREIIVEGITTIKSGDFSTDQATLDVYLTGTRTMLQAMTDSGERASLMAANVANLEVASKAGYGDRSLYAQLHTMRTH